MTSIASNNLVQVEYIGTKERKEDNLTGSGVVWQGHGDVQHVTAAQWGTLSKHSEVWRRVEITGNVTTLVAPTPKASEATKSLLLGDKINDKAGLTAEQVHAAKFEFPDEAKPAASEKVGSEQPPAKTAQPARKKAPNASSKAAE